MASLKEVKTRIASVRSTRQITLARQMVSSAQLHRAQGLLEKAVTYKEAIDKLLEDLRAASPDFFSPLMRKRSGGAVALVAMSSNTGMAGSFNARIIKHISQPEKLYPGREVLIYPIGKKVREALEFQGRHIEGDFDYLMDKPTSKQVSELVDRLKTDFLSGRVAQVDIVGFHFKSMGTQELVTHTLLPYGMGQEKKDEYQDEALADSYILEPSARELLDSVLPLALVSNFYTALIDNQTSEHAARMIAMQGASENADELIDELQLTYNKVRQQNITTELMDIIGSSFA